MIASERHELILKELELRGSLRVTEFAHRSGVSAMTLRRDLQLLAQKSLLARVHGGAVSLVVAAAHHGEEGSRGPRRPLATIGMVVPSASYYYPEVIRGAKAAAKELNCRLVLAVSDYSSELELHQARRLIAAGVDGLLVTPTEPLSHRSELYQVLTAPSVAVVVVERSADEDLTARHLDSVRSDHAYGAEIAVLHLASLGHRRIGLAVRDSPTTRWLIEGHARAVAFLGLDEDSPIHVLHRSPQGGPSYDDLAAVLDDYSAHDVHAALVLTDIDAIALVDMATERGLSVPRDFAVVAYDDEVASLGSVPLTAVSPAKRDLGRLAMTTCFERISTPPGSEPRAVTRIALLPELKVRESTVPAT